MTSLLKFCSASLVGIASLTCSTLAQQEFFTPKEDLAGLEASSELNADLPNVFLIGDSISIGYNLTVTELLMDSANVQRPEVNCGNTDKGMRELDTWLGDTKWDIIHFNWGLHDLCYRHPDSKETGHRDKINGTISIPLEDYKVNLEALVERLEQTGATLIWATTTPVPEGEIGRFPGDELKYNAAAREIMLRHQIEINDLHQVASEFDASQWKGPGNVHFNQEGSAALGQRVAETIKAHLE